MKPYFGGTGISLEKLCKILPNWNIDGTRYKMEDWLAECAVLETLIEGKSEIWIPYGSAERFGILRRVVWDKINFKGYGFSTEETEDWWFYEPYMEVEYYKEGDTIENPENCYYVYEYTFYKKQKHKVQRAYLQKVKRAIKGKFLSLKDIADIKKKAAIENSVTKRSNK